MGLLTRDIYSNKRGKGAGEVPLILNINPPTPPPPPPPMVADNNTPVLPQRYPYVVVVLEVA